jgi:hypothetical protein
VAIATTVDPAGISRFVLARDVANLFLMRSE